MNTETVIKMVGDFFDLTAEDFTPKQLAEEAGVTLSKASNILGSLDF